MARLYNTILKLQFVSIPPEAVVDIIGVTD